MACVLSAKVLTKPCYGEFCPAQLTHDILVFVLAGDVHRKFAWGPIFLPAAAHVRLVRGLAIVVAVNVVLEDLAVRKGAFASRLRARELDVAVLGTIVVPKTTLRRVRLVAAFYRARVAATPLAHVHDGIVLHEVAVPPAARGQRGGGGGGRGVQRRGDRREGLLLARTCAGCLREVIAQHARPGSKRAELARDAADRAGVAGRGGARARTDAPALAQEVRAAVVVVARVTA
mmetsp:Transcript_7225/g.21261  ORF Transcript_7225/g.21261 Transcript_7225/m.21261 type:complete len:232 (+) Transcript_7225:183-878(+)